MTDKEEILQDFDKEIENYNQHYIQTTKQDEDPKELVEMIMHALADLLDEKRHRDYDYKAFADQEVMEEIDKKLREELGLDDDEAIVELQAPNEVLVKVKQE